MVTRTTSQRMTVVRPVTQQLGEVGGRIRSPETDASTVSGEGSR
jgi:hypothetical protein